MLWKCCTQYASKFGKLSSGHRTGKGQFSFQSQRKINAKKAKWLIEEDLQIAGKRREVKGKGERERHTQVNAEFQEERRELRKPSSVISAKK